MNLTKSQLKQMIEEQLEGLLSERRPRRGIETTSDTPVLPKIEPRAAEAEGSLSTPEVKTDVAHAAKKPDPYAEPKWDPEAMQRHHSEAALYDDLRRWRGKGQFKHHAPSALSTGEIEGVKARWHAGMKDMLKSNLTDAQKRKVFRMAMSKAGQIGGEGHWNLQRSLGDKGGERYHRLSSVPFSNLVTGLSGGQRKELHKNLAKSGYWKKLHPSSPIRQDFEKSAYYKKPTKRRRRKKKKPVQKFQSFVATDAKTGKPITRTQARKMSTPVRESQLKQMIEEEVNLLLEVYERGMLTPFDSRMPTRQARQTRQGPTDTLSPSEWKENWLPDFLNPDTYDIESSYAPTWGFQQGAEKWEDDPSIEELIYKSGMPIPEESDHISQLDKSLGDFIDDEGSQELFLMGPGTLSKHVRRALTDLYRQPRSGLWRKHGQFGKGATHRGLKYGHLAGLGLLPYDVAKEIENWVDINRRSQGYDQWDLENKLGLGKLYMSPEQAEKETELWHLLQQYAGLSPELGKKETEHDFLQSQEHELSPDMTLYEGKNVKLKQIIEEQLEGFLNEARPPRGPEGPERRPRVYPWDLLPPGYRIWSPEDNPEPPPPLPHPLDPDYIAESEEDSETTTENLTKQDLKEAIEEMLTAELNSKTRSAKISPRKKTPDLKQIIEEEVDYVLSEKRRKRKQSEAEKILQMHDKAKKADDKNKLVRKLKGLPAQDRGKGIADPPSRAEKVRRSRVVNKRNKEREAEAEARKLNPDDSKEKKPKTKPRKRMKFSPPTGDYKAPDKDIGKKMGQVIKNKKMRKGEKEAPLPGASNRKKLEKRKAEKKTPTNKERKATKWTTAKKMSKEDHEAYGRTGKKGSLARRAKTNKPHPKSIKRIEQYKSDKGAADAAKAKRLKYGEDELGAMKKRYKQLPISIRYKFDAAAKGDPKAIDFMKRWDKASKGVSATGKSGIGGRKIPLLGKIINAVTPEYGGAYPQIFQDIARKKEIMKYRNTPRGRELGPKPQVQKPPKKPPEVEPKAYKGNFKQSGASKATTNIAGKEADKLYGVGTANKPKSKKKPKNVTAVGKKDVWV